MRRTNKFYKLEARKAALKNQRDGITGGDAPRIRSELELKLDVPFCSVTVRCIRCALGKLQRFGNVCGITAITHVALNEDRSNI